MRRTAKTGKSGIPATVALCLHLSLALCLGGCGTSFLPSAGPDKIEVETQARKSHVAVIEVNDAVTRRLKEGKVKSSFADAFGDKPLPDYVVGPGDVLEVVIWEAQPAALFSAPTTALPPQMVAADGTINVPFAGTIDAAGFPPHEIQKRIAKRLVGKAHEPQVLVQVSRNFSSNVNIVGEVGQNVRMPLTARGEKLLDALAVAGGVRQPIDKTTIQITRNGQVHAMPLDVVTRDPRQNIALAPGDVITALFQPLSFTAMGATGASAAGAGSEVNFEAKGITLSQALGRIGGLSSLQANPQGVFIFRFEDPALVDDESRKFTTPDGKVPAVYRLNLKDPGAFLLAQSFPVNDKDIIYIAEAPAVEFQKFMNLLFTTVFSVNRIVNM